MAGDLGEPVGLAGQLTGVYSLSFAIAAPLGAVLAGRVRRKRLMLVVLGVFAAGNLLAAASPSIAVLFVARVVMAAAAALVSLLATRFATELVPPAQRGRAIGIIFMGISGSLVLGVPAGMAVSAVGGWRSAFCALAVGAVAAGIACWWWLPSAPTRGAARAGGGAGASAADGEAGRADVRADGGARRRMRRPVPLISGQFVSILLLTGHFALFGFLAPYLTGVAGVDEGFVIAAFCAFGVAGVTGGYLGGWLADRAGSRRALGLTPTAYLAALLLLPLATAAPAAFVPAMMAWGCISWMISPVVQSFLLDVEPEASELSIGLNLSAMHIGVGAGTALGGLALTGLPLSSLPLVGAVPAAAAVGAAAIALLTARRSAPVR